MSASTCPSVSVAARPPRGQRASSRRNARRRRTPADSHASAPPALGRYRDRRGHLREVVARPGAAGSTLVIDRDAATMGDRRLVAHLGAEEPIQNAALVCECFIRDARRRPILCRLLTAADLRVRPLEEVPLEAIASSSGASPEEVCDPLGRRYRLGRVQAALKIPELRWRRIAISPSTPDQTLSVRAVIASVERYEPVLSLTRRVLEREESDSGVSSAVLRVELARVKESPIVLNRALREAVEHALERGGLSMSEIAIRCGRVKHDAGGNQSGETSWLARRLGILPEGGRSTPTPWVHSDVLALIARDGLGLTPREVESD